MSRNRVQTAKTVVSVTTHNCTLTFCDTDVLWLSGHVPQSTGVLALSESVLVNIFLDTCVIFDI